MILNLHKLFQTHFTEEVFLTKLSGANILINAVLFWLIGVLNEKKKLCICVEIWVKCKVKLKCIFVPKAVSNI